MKVAVVEHSHGYTLENAEIADELFNKAKSYYQEAEEYKNEAIANIKHSYPGTISIKVNGVFSNLTEAFNDLGIAYSRIANWGPNQYIASQKTLESYVKSFYQKLIAFAQVKSQFKYYMDNDIEIYRDEDADKEN